MVNASLLILLLYPWEKYENKAHTLGYHTTGGNRTPDKVATGSRAPHIYQENKRNKTNQKKSRSLDCCFVVYCVIPGMYVSGIILILWSTGSNLGSRCWYTRHPADPSKVCRQVYRQTDRQAPISRKCVCRLWRIILVSYVSCIIHTVLWTHCMQPVRWLREAIMNNSMVKYDR